MYNRQYVVHSGIWTTARSPVTMPTELPYHRTLLYALLAPMCHHVHSPTEVTSLERSVLWCWVWPRLGPVTYYWRLSGGFDSRLQLADSLMPRTGTQPYCVLDVCMTHTMWHMSLLCARCIACMAHRQQMAQIPPRTTINIWTSVPPWHQASYLGVE